MRRMIGALSAIGLIATGLVIGGVTPALADPSANAWASLRQCESGGYYAINTGNGYFGAYQFDLGTWRAVGGSGLPSDASAAEQDYRALYLYRKRGFEPWICASLAGLTDAGDGSARSGKVPTRSESAYMSGGSGSFQVPNTNACNVGKSTAPAWGGVTFVKGKTYRDLICWQRQLGNRGYGLQGSGHFGSNTLAALHAFEAARRLPTTNVIDQRTWVAAWGKSGGLKPGVKPVTSTPTKPKPTAHAKPKPTKPKPTKPKPTKPATGSGVKLYPGITSASCHVGAAKAPGWPKKFFTMGDTDKALACWQLQMNHRGYTKLHGSGNYGANTLAAAKSIQNRNHLGGTGLIGPKTWKAAWEGRAG